MNEQQDEYKKIAEESAEQAKRIEAMNPYEKLKVLMTEINRYNELDPEARSLEDTQAFNKSMAGFTRIYNKLSRKEKRKLIAPNLKRSAKTVQRLKAANLR
jgi:hypothetical protein